MRGALVFGNFLLVSLMVMMTNGQSGGGQVCYEGFANFDQGPLFGLSVVTCDPGSVCGTLYGTANIGGHNISGILTTCRPENQCSQCPDAAETYMLGIKFNATFQACNSSKCCDEYLCNLPKPSCPSNQVYSTCAGCDRTCADVGRNIPCPSVCRQKCTCPHGMYLDGETCVTADNCPGLPPINCPPLERANCSKAIRSLWICDYIKWRIHSRKVWLPSFNKWSEEHGIAVSIPECPTLDVKCKDGSQVYWYTDAHQCSTPYCVGGRYSSGPTVQTWKREHKSWTIVYELWKSTPSTPIPIDQNC
ncbi:uncharacterized protein LOC100179015 [Ciona intestinalis]